MVSIPFNNLPFTILYTSNQYPPPTTTKKKTEKWGKIYLLPITLTSAYYIILKGRFLRKDRGEIGRDSGKKMSLKKKTEKNLRL